MAGRAGRLLPSRPRPALPRRPAIRGRARGRRPQPRPGRPRLRRLPLSGPQQCRERCRNRRSPARVFGPSSPGSFASFDPATSSWRTSPPSSPERGSDGTEARSDEFSATWPKHGMTRSGRACRLESSGHRICESGSGSWPTPHGMPKPGQRRNPGPSGNELGRAVNEAERRTWPTPTRSDSKGGPGNSGRQGGENLKTAVAREASFPTPKAQDAKHAAPTDWEKTNRPKDLHVRVGGALNPPWVEWLMGFPIGWTALPPSATPSSRRSRSGSGAASSNTSGSRDGSR